MILHAPDDVPQAFRLYLARALCDKTRPLHGFGTTQISGAASLATLLGCRVAHVLRSFNYYHCPFSMHRALEHFNRPARQLGAHTWPMLGLARLSIQGPWLDIEGGDLEHRHWVALAFVDGIDMVYDINKEEGGGWDTRAEWETTTMRRLLGEDADHEGATGWRFFKTLEIIDP